MSMPVKERFSLPKLLHSIFNFFASVKLAIFLLSLLTLALIAGTVLESYSGARAAQYFVYKTFAFSVLLVLLALSVICATLDRYPWRKEHIGFIITHIGVVTLLTGSWMTQVFGIDGQMPLVEGEKSDTILLNQEIAELSAVHGSFRKRVRVTPRPFAWKGEETLLRIPEKNLEFSLLEYLPYAQVIEKIAPQKSGKPAVEISLARGDSAESFKMTEWLILNEDASGSVLALGPAEVRFEKWQPARELLAPKSSSQNASRGLVVMQGEFGERVLSVASELGRPVPIPGSKATLTIAEYFPHATVQGKNIVSLSDKPENPACRVLIKGKNFEETHLLFALFPDFASEHGRGPSQAGIRLKYIFPDLKPEVSRPALILRVKDGKELYYQVRGGRSPMEKEEPLKAGESYAIGWMDLQFTVKQFLPEASWVETVQADPSGFRSERAVPAAYFRLKSGEDVKESWFVLGGHRDFVAGGEHLQVVFGKKAHRLPFGIQLEDFQLEHYPVSSRPREFKSRIRVLDPDRITPAEHTISMNRPLTYRGYRFFQSGYQEGQAGEGRGEVSIFSVGKDIGTPVKYWGSIILVIGVLMMFWRNRSAAFKKTIEKEKVG